MRRRLGDGTSPPSRTSELELIACLASKALGVAAALVVVDDGRRRVAASHGIEVVLSLASSDLCSTAIRGAETLVIGDASQDARFCSDPLVAASPHTRFFASRPLFVVSTAPVGALILLDPRPGELDESGRATLDEFGELLEAFLERSRQGLAPDEVSAAFPFAFVLDRGLRIVHCGRSLATVCGRPVLGALFDEIFLIRRPAIEPRFEELAAARGTSFAVESALSRAVLRGSISTIGSGDTLMFLGSPGLRSAGDLESLGLGPGDFALHDQAMELLTLLEDRARSIVELQQLNVEITRAKARAEDATRATSTFLAHMSHELRTPMNAVLGMATLILDTDLGAAQRNYAETIRSSGESLLAVVNDVLDFSKLESGMMTIEEVPFAPLRIIDEALALVALPATRKGLELAGLCEPDVPAWLRGDPSRIRQILLNLLSNAVKFTLAGHAVVTARYESATSFLEVEVLDTGIGLTLEMQRAVFEPFKQAESSTTRRFGGTGLGLTISRRLAVMMGGTLEVASTVDQGSRFVLRLPCPPATPPAGTSLQSVASSWRAVVVDAESLHERALRQRLSLLGAEVTTVATMDDASKAIATGSVQLLVVGARTAEEARSAVARNLSQAPPILLCVPVGVTVGEFDGRVIQRPAALTHLARAVAEMLRSPSSSERLTAIPPSPPLRVLLVEDDLVNQRVASLLLARIGLRCDIASNGLQAVERASAQQYDVILMDMQMPELDGVEATRRIRALHIEQPAIVALSASTMASEQRACFDAGVNGFLAKPLKPDELLETMTKVAAGQPLGPGPDL